MRGPGPVNLGGELTVRHSALLVVDDAHSCCYNLWRATSYCKTTDKTSMTKHIFSSSTVLFRRTPALESLDLSALLNLAENPSLAPQHCL